MRFVVDGMLGGLARWLRILGHDVLYDTEFADKVLLDRATEGMTLLTRDQELHNRAVSKNLPTLLITGRTESERLAQVSQHLGISLTVDLDRTLCPECGGSLKNVSREEVSGLVPSASLRVYDRFWRCANTNCGKVYWKGAHWRQINQTLTEARLLAGA